MGFTTESPDRTNICDMETLSASQQQQIKKMADEHLRTKLVATGYDEELAWSWEREDLLSRYAEVLLEGANPKVAPAPVDPALERDRLAFQMKRWEAEQQRWEAEQAERKLQKKEEKQRWEAQQEERRLQKEEDMRKW